MIMVMIFIMMIISIKPIQDFSLTVVLVGCLWDVGGEAVEGGWCGEAFGPAVQADAP